MVSAADARFGELSCRSADGIHERQPVLSDRTPSVSRPTEQPVRRNQRACSGALRQVRPSLHHRIPWPAIHAVVLDNPQARSTKLLRATSDDAPETNSELKFRIRDGVRESFGVDPTTGKRRGLRTALRELETGAIATGSTP